MSVVSLGPKWLELKPGFKIRVKPVSRLMSQAAARAMAAAKTAAEEDGADEQTAIDAGGDAYTRQMAQDAIIDWGGDIPDGDDGKTRFVTTADGDLIGQVISDEAGDPCMVTPENITMLMDQDAAFIQFDAQYVGPYLDERNAKNASSPTSNGSQGPAEAKAIASTATNSPDNSAVDEIADS